MATTNETENLITAADAAYAAWEAACDRCTAIEVSMRTCHDPEEYKRLAAAQRAAFAEKKTIRAAYDAADLLANPPEEG